MLNLAAGAAVRDWFALADAAEQITRALGAFSLQGYGDSCALLHHSYCVHICVSRGKVLAEPRSHSDSV